MGIKFAVVIYTFLLATVLVFIYLFFRSPVRTEAQAPEGFVNEVFVSGLNSPTYIDFTPDGRALISEFNCTIKLVLPGKTTIESAPLLTIPNCAEYLISTVLDPNFSQNGYIYAFYIAKNPRTERVSRFTVTGNTANPASEKLLWQADEGEASTATHLGGALAFGNDGKLYISTGDHGNNTINPDKPSQKLSSFLGKILRINPDGTIPADNPFIDGTGPNKDAVWALGLRNPFRIFFDKKNDKFYITDIGQNKTEEVNIGVKGANYGWPDCEGTCSSPGMTNPIFTYDQVPGKRASITGGFIYSGTQFPPKYNGVYFYGDFVRNVIRYLVLNGNGTVADYAFEPANESGAPAASIMDVTGGPDGMLYYVDMGGTVRRIRYIPHSLKFDGIDDMVKTNNIPVSKNFTFEAWIKRSRDTNNAEIIFSDFAKASGKEMYRVFVDGNSQKCGGTDQLAFLQQNGNSLQCSGQTINVGPWYHVAISKKANGERKMFINGKLVSTNTNAPAPADSDGAGSIGRSGSVNEGYFAGFIDEVRISDIARYQSNFSPPLSNLGEDANTVALWHFDEGYGQTTIDSSQNKLHGTLGKNETETDWDPAWKIKSKIKMIQSGEYMDTEVVE